jgi:hypothetical protein
MKSVYLGIVQTAMSMIMVYAALNIFNFTMPIVLTATYMFLAVQGSMAVFSIRAYQSSLLNSMPAPFFAATLILAQLAAIFISVYGLAMAPLHWLNALYLLIYIITTILIFDLNKQLYESIIEQRIFHSKPPTKQVPL